MAADTLGLVVTIVVTDGTIAVRPLEHIICTSAHCLVFFVLHTLALAGAGTVFTCSSLVHLGTGAVRFAVIIHCARAAVLAEVIALVEDILALRPPEARGTMAAHMISSGDGVHTDTGTIIFTVV